MEPIQLVVLRINEMIRCGRISREDSLFLASQMHRIGALEQETVNYLKTNPFMVSQVIDIQAEVAKE